MGGFASFIGGMGEGFPTPRDLLYQRFSHGENERALLHTRAKALSDALEKLRAEYPEDEGVRQLYSDAQLMSLTGKIDDATLNRLGQQTIKARQEANRRMAEAAQTAAVQARNTPAVNQAIAAASGQPQAAPSAPSVPPVSAQSAQPPNPLAGMIGSGGGGGGATAAPLAQPPTSPVQPQMQGGGSNPNAPFRTESVPGDRAGAPSLLPPALPPVAPDNGPQPGGLGDLDAPVLTAQSSTASVAPLLDLDPEIRRLELQAAQTGYVSPFLKELRSKQAGTQAAMELEGRKGQLTREQSRQRANDVEQFFGDINLTPEQRAYILAEAYNPSMQFPTPPASLYELSAGEALVGPDGKLIYQNPASSAPGTSAFSVAKSALEGELGRPLTSNEVVELDRRLAGGEPLYPVVRGDTVTYVPRSAAAGQAAPRTLYNLEGMPQTGGQMGMSLTPPAPPPVATQQQITGLKNSIGQFRSIESKLNDPEYAEFGPIAGRVTVGLARTLGGAFLTPKQVELVADLQRLLSSQAFQDGGKQLTPTELQQFILITPSLSDTLQQAIVKTREAIKFLNMSYQNRISTMTPRQRSQMDLSLPGEPQSNLPMLPPPGGQPPRTAEEYLRGLGGR